MSWPRVNQRTIQQLDKEYGKDNWNLKGGKGYAAAQSVKGEVSMNNTLKPVTVYAKLPEPEPASTPEPASPAPEPTPEPEKELKDITLSQQAQKTNQIVSDWESGGGDYIRDESPFSQGAKAVFGGNTPSSETTDQGNESSDQQKNAQDFMNSYKDSLKKALFNPSGT